MGVPLHFHVALQSHRAGPGHAAKVVAAQINQHDMLRAFLGVIAKLGSQAGVFQIVRPALACARYG